MGAQSFIHTKEATSPSEAFDELVDYATYKYGHDAYNGTISTCSLGRRRTPLNLKPKYCKENESIAYKFVQDNDNGEKWVADYIDLGETSNGEHMYMFFGWASC